MSVERWYLFEVFPNRLEADRKAAFLQSSGVPAYVDTGALGAGLEGEFKLFVDAGLVHRARWLISLPGVTDAELDFLATGQLSRPD